MPVRAPLPRKKKSTKKKATVVPTERHGFRIAAIDVGSNSLHMVVAQVDADGGVTTLWRMKEMVGLGRISFPSRRLSREAMDRAVTTLRRFQQAARSRKCEKILAVATSAVREAENGGDFLERCRQELSLRVRVISAKDEARLIYMGVRHAVDLGDRPHFIVDVGGGSVEFIVADGQKASLLESRKLGAARMTAKYVSTDPISPADLKGLMSHYDRELKPLCESINALKPVAALGTSGTLENLAAMSAGFSASKNPVAAAGVIEKESLSRLVTYLTSSKSAERAGIPGLDDQRKDQIIAGAVLINELLARLNVPQITLCKSALREGILMDYLARNAPELSIRREVPDTRRRSVLDLARRCDWHQTHSEHVAKLCLNLFDETKTLHRLKPADRELIEYGALLHDIGWHISQDQHHKHSEYLIQNGQLRDFTPEEIQVMASIARYHRKSEPTLEHPSYATLSKHAKAVVNAGAALLRIADGLDRSHCQVVTGVRCRVSKHGVAVRIKARGDAELELWGARRKMGFFAETFDRSVGFDLTDK